MLEVQTMGNYREETQIFFLVAKWGSKATPEKCGLEIILACPSWTPLSVKGQFPKNRFLDIACAVDLLGFYLPYNFSIILGRKITTYLYPYASFRLQNIGPISEEEYFSRWYNFGLQYRLGKKVKVNFEINLPPADRKDSDTWIIYPRFGVNLEWKPFRG